MHPLSALVLAAASLLQWTSVSLLGWTRDGAAVVWEGKVYSLEKPDGVLPCERVFLIVTDADGRAFRVCRRSSRVPMDEVTWRDDGTDSLWNAAPPEPDADSWLAAHPLAPAPAARRLAGRLDAKGPRQTLVARVALKGSRCPTATLTAALGTATAPVAEDRCPEDAPHPKLASRLQVVWSPDGTRAALAWTTSRTAADGDEIEQGHFALVSRRALCRVELLDGGAGLDSAAARLARRGYTVARRGKAAAPATATTVSYAPGFLTEAREVAALLGAGPKAVQPSRAKSEYPLRVVVGPRR